MLDYDEDRLVHKKGDREPNRDLEKLAHRINLDEDRFVSFEHGTAKDEKHKNKHTDKKNRATCEQVLDPRTRIILLKLISKAELSEINGCISTGKEANVYHALSAEKESTALKVFKTSILCFKDRKRYVEGEFRFRNGYMNNNPRKMVRQWAEKEFRNLKRLEKAGLPSPRPHFVKQHVLGMSFVGDSATGVAAPKLKNIPGIGPDIFNIYRQTLKLTRALYRECLLVHGDLSEYNLLVHSGTVYVIDVSQSVENDNPQALGFLKRDCKNILSFFRSRQVQTISIRQLFDFVTDTGSFSDLDEHLDILHECIEEETPEDKIAEGVFLDSHIPRTLQEADEDPAYNTETALHATVTGIKTFALREDNDSSATESEEPEPHCALTKEELKANRKDNKTAVKELNRARRAKKALKKKLDKRKGQKTKRK